MVLLAALLTGYVLVEKTGLTELIIDVPEMIKRMRELGVIGPLMVISLMILAIVLNPLPSAPIALASGAVYGHTWGTLYIITGATIGAMIAFLIARFSGHRAINKLIPEHWSLGRLGSQNALMVMIFVSRLIPFLSFDLISYAAGVTSISLWRFFLATLFGLIPASFLLAHFGGEMAQADFQSMSLFILVAGLLTLPPVLYQLYKQRNRANKKDTGEKHEY
jgi:uncharacterized membrane protein YdjX (TVP38/TMEM64 family)